MNRRLFQPLGVRVEWRRRFADGNPQLSGGASNAVIATVSAGNLPRGIMFNPQNNRVYVSNYASDNITVIDGNSNAAIATIPVGDEPTAFCYSPVNKKIYWFSEWSHSVSAGKYFLKTDQGVFRLVRL